MPLELKDAGGRLMEGERLSDREDDLEDGNGALGLVGERQFSKADEEAGGVWDQVRGIGWGRLWTSRSRGAGDRGDMGDAGAAGAGDVSEVGLGASKGRPDGPDGRGFCWAR